MISLFLDGLNDARVFFSVDVTRIRLSGYFCGSRNLHRIVMKESPEIVDDY